MTGSELEQAVSTIEALGLTKIFDSIADTYKDGKRIRRDQIEPLITMRLVNYERGIARVTHTGYEVSTRIIVKRAQRDQKPGYWRT